jgi:hypothetical protein
LTGLLRKGPPPSDYRIAPGAEITWSTGQIWGVRSLPVVFSPGAR